MAQCEFAKGDGTQCRGHSLTGKAFCYFHDPETKDQLKESTVKGGKAACRPRKTVPESDYRLKSTHDVTGLLIDTINEVRSGELDPKISNAVGYLANILLKAFEQGEMDERIKRLEDILEKSRK